ncbi:hypothetical protein [Proteus hauseri]|uniref:hypothetical protein n=1 Tax=Proteus hauseri TaxID=183417 RepID=UPI0032DA3D7F
MERFGTGSDLQKAAQVVTCALASGASPYLVTEIKKRTTVDGEVNITTNALAHTILGAVTAELNNQLAVAKGENAVVQAAGAMTGETMGILSHSLYGKTPEELTSLKSKI